MGPLVLLGRVHKPTPRRSIKFTKFTKFTKFKDTLRIERRTPEVINRSDTPRAQYSVATRQEIICSLETEEAKELVE